MTLRTGLAACFATFFMVSLANASPPPDKFELHCVLPADPATGAHFQLLINLVPVAQNGNTVGWSVSTIDIMQFDSGNSEIGRWSDQSSTLNTADGLFWIRHENPGTPELSEFQALPLLTGAAPEAGAATTPSLEYSLEANSTAAEVSGSVMVKEMNYVLKFADEFEPVAEGEDDPIWIDEEESTISQAELLVV
ncbi:MAG: hypothetical protein IPK83_09550 [Planctomycetes bacterium]|nr:hypothetical protein [Planctomycetota bacterium]